jgi:hypothetical protein
MSQGRTFTTRSPRQSVSALVAAMFGRMLGRKPDERVAPSIVLPPSRRARVRYRMSSWQPGEQGKRECARRRRQYPLGLGCRPWNRHDAAARRKDDVVPVVSLRELAKRSRA